MAKVVSFAAYETIGIGIPNPRPVVVFPLPAELPTDARQRIDSAIRRLETMTVAEFEVEQSRIEAEIDRILREERPSQENPFVFDEDDPIG